jgi:hypothetical protein
MNLRAMSWSGTSRIGLIGLALPALLWLTGCADLTRVQEIQVLRVVAKPAAALVRSKAGLPGLPAGIQINRKAKTAPGVNLPPTRPRRGG